MESDPKEQRVHGDKVGGDQITVGDITSSSGIAIGRGSQIVVTGGVKGVVKGGVKEVDVESVTPSFQFRDLVDVLQDGDLTPEEQEQAGTSLARLKKEVDLGDAADVELATETLIDISKVDPEFGQSVWQWLSEDADVSMPIKIVARKLLS